MPSGVAIGEVPKWRRPRRTQVSQASAAATELRAEKGGTYVAHLGTMVPSPEVMASCLQLGAGWSTEVQRAEAWLDYAKGQEAVTWSYALDQIAAVHDSVVSAESRSASFSTAFPVFIGVVTARTVSGQRAARTVKANKKRDAETQKVVAGAAATPSAPAAASSTPAPTGVTTPHA